MNQKFHPEQIKQLLNRSLAMLDQPTLTRLRNARTQSLARYDAHSAAPAFAWASLWAEHRHATDSHRKSHYLAAAVLLVALLFSGAAYWHHTADRDVSDVDIAILTDELPIEMYVD
ncbi:MAG: DUF3619 family protein [Betaproteobacteria bacterium]|nr:DUF3619 family protein [Betaproteobacteria bacterium]MDE2310016.1 DUF3619 family protein [Betaproteobacteria bacterium]